MINQDQSFSQINNSPTKQQYSFPKAQRLASMFKPYCQSQYDIPNTLSKRTTTLGYGKRGQRSFSQAPAPGSYSQTQQTIEESIKHSRGISMGVSRDQSTASGILSTFKNDSPGPGMFVPKSTLSQIRYSIPTRAATGGIADLMSRNGVPGPGQYTRLPELNPEGKYVESKMKNLRSIKFNKYGGLRFLEIKEITPGPGSYENQLKNINGNYSISTVINSRKTIIPKQTKLIRVASTSVGPGSYELPSEFGQLSQRLRKKLV